jgi:superfamily II DNA or RNA helicase
MMKDTLYRLDSAAWFADSQELRDQFTRVDRFGEQYNMYTTDVEQDLIGLPRNLARSIEGNFCYSDDYGWKDGFVPRDDEQERLVADSTHLFKNEKSLGFILQAPTGYGKTYLGSAIIQRVGQRACVITTKQDIMKDWRTALSNVLCVPESDVHLWHGDKVPDESAHAVVALVQSVCKGPARYPKELYEMFGMVLVDEVHRMGAEKFSEAMWHFPARYRLGLSASPYRKDGREKVFEAHIGEVEVGTTEKALPFKVIMQRTTWKAPHVWNYQTKKKGPLIIPWDRTIIAVKHLQDDVYRNRKIAQFLKVALDRERNTVVFSDTVEHLTAIRDFCIDEGIDPEVFGYYVGLQNPVYKRKKADQPLDANGKTTGYRERIRERDATKPVVLATYKMCSEATNKPWWDTAVFATSKADVLQIAGRIRREYPDKKTPVILDLVDNHEVFLTFAKKRKKWYAEEGAEVVLKSA